MRSSGGFDGVVWSMAKRRYYAKRNGDLQQTRMRLVGRGRGETENGLNRAAKSALFGACDDRALPALQHPPR